MAFTLSKVMKHSCSIVNNHRDHVAQFTADAISQMQSFNIPVYGVLNIQKALVCQNKVNNKKQHHVLAKYFFNTT